MRNVERASRKKSIIALQEAKQTKHVVLKFGAPYNSNFSCCSPGFQTGWKGRRGCVNLSQHTWRAWRQTESSLLGFCLIWRRHWWWWQRCPCMYETHSAMSLKKGCSGTRTVKTFARERATDISPGKPCCHRYLLLKSCIWKWPSASPLLVQTEKRNITTVDEVVQAVNAPRISTFKSTKTERRSSHSKNNFKRETFVITDNRITVWVIFLNQLLPQQH